MKRYTPCLFTALLALGIQGTSWSNHHGDKLDGIIQRFSTDDTAAQYEARRELASYVADATAPSQAGGAEKVTRELLAFLADRNVNYEARKYIIRDLALVGTGTAVAPLSKIMLGKDSLLAEDARQALEQIPDKRATDAVKKAIASEKNDATRQSYIRTLANRRDPGTFDYFAKGLSSRDSILALESVYALTKMGDAKSSAALEKAYNAGRSRKIRPELERSVVSRDSTSAGTLLKIARSGVSSANRQAALTLLVESEHSETDELLSSAIAGSDARLRATALRLALENGKQALVQNHAANFSSNDWRIVLGALRAFNPAVAENLALQALEHSETGIKAEGLRALGMYGSKRSIDTLLEHFSGRDRELQQAAIYAIERMPVNALNNRVNQLLNSESADEIELGLKLCAHRGLNNAKNRLFKVINGEDMALARVALQTLSVTANEEDLYRLLFLTRRSKNEALSNMINGMLKKVAADIGSLELKAKVAAL